MEVTCRCGWITRGTKAEVIANIQEHGRSAHQLEVTPEEVRAVWRVVDEGAGKRDGGR
jgi:predicted small metal-binding protein